VIRTFKEEGRLTSTDVIRTQSTGKNTIPRCDVGRNGKPQAVKFSMMLQLDDTYTRLDLGSLARRGITAVCKKVGGRDELPFLE